MGTTKIEYCGDSFTANGFVACERCDHVVGVKDEFTPCPNCGAEEISDNYSNAGIWDVFEFFGKVSHACYMKYIDRGFNDNLSFTREIKKYAFNLNTRKIKEI